MSVVAVDRATEYPEGRVPTQELFGATSASSRYLCISLASLAGRALVNSRHDFEVAGADRLMALHPARGGAGKERGLLTVMNHISILDEPCLLPCAFFSHWELVDEPEVMPWSPTSASLSFRSALRAWFCRNVQAVPLQKGGGVHQPELRVITDLLGRGKWVNFFPEGRVRQDSTLGPIKSGVGRLIYDPEVTPVVLPIAHTGLNLVKPVGRVPALWERKTVRAEVGTALDLADMVREMKATNVPKEEAYARIAAIVEEALRKEYERVVKGRK